MLYTLVPEVEEVHERQKRDRHCNHPGLDVDVILDILVPGLDVDDLDVPGLDVDDLDVPGLDVDVRGLLPPVLVPVEPLTQTYPASNCVCRVVLGNLKESFGFGEQKTLYFFAMHFL